MRPHTIQSVPLNELAERMSGLIRGEMTSPGLADWLLAEFSTTESQDRAVAAMLFMGTMKEYFVYHALIGCGFPSVTLHGKREDWVDIMKRSERFASFGEELAAWSRCLAKALEYMVASFDRPDDADIRDFWMRACHSGGDDHSTDFQTLSGWVTVFAWWAASGKRQKAHTDKEIAGLSWLSREDVRLRKFDGVKFPVVLRNEIPAGYTRVPIVWHDVTVEKPFYSILVAGSVGMKLMDSEGTRARPASGWWLLHTRSREDVYDSGSDPD